MKWCTQDTMERIVNENQDYVHIESEVSGQIIYQFQRASNSYYIKDQFYSHRQVCDQQEMSLPSPFSFLELLQFLVWYINSL